MSLLSKLFGRTPEPAPAPAPEPVDHKGYRIFAEPVKTDGGWRVAGRIEREVDGTTRSHILVRADVAGDRDQAVDATLRKCRQIIDQQGDGIF